MCGTQDQKGMTIMRKMKKTRKSWKIDSTNTPILPELPSSDIPPMPDVPDTRQSLHPVPVGEESNSINVTIGRIESNLDYMEADLMKKWSFIKYVTRDIVKLKEELKKAGIL